MAGGRGKKVKVVKFVVLSKINIHGDIRSQAKNKLKSPRASRRVTNILGGRLRQSPPDQL
jgi:hypothetical protein